MQSSRYQADKALLNGVTLMVAHMRNVGVRDESIRDYLVGYIDDALDEKYAE